MTVRTSSRRNPTTPSVSFYCLPKVISNQCDRTRQLSEKRRKLWLEKINRRELYFKKDIRICSVHFISGLARAVSPAVTQVRFRRIRGRNPREPFFEKKAILEVCKPIFGRDETPSWERCSLTRRTETPEPFVRLARAVSPAVTQVRFRRIRGRNPREPFFEKKAILEVCKPIFGRDETPSWERCSLTRRTETPEPFVHPYQRILADKLRAELHEAGLICFFHENPILRDDRRDIHNMLYKKGFFLKNYSNRVVQLAIAAGIAHDRFLSRDDLQWLSTVPNVEYLLGQTCGILSSTASGLYRLTSHHQNRLSLLLASHAEQQTTAGETKTEAPETKTDQP
ncbi:hypothetical protein IscW_ISCW021101 [Ixodes scapularis]|uniref:Large ribosomal subunit protein uL10m n=1 Tax=Ixodes scapularis TaxID=6945 RepID=B7Q3X2_IXOSC|nr:hypothetical protein IscW_ISCW021101 [Ixodes scapularis]|eukprot:XP_002399682.1 hypothetical protein IscW_ISCW021101 [Ixodes scapularis]